MIAAPLARGLKGHLRLVAHGLHVGLPLDRVVRVALVGDERRLAPRENSEPWWRGLAVSGRTGVPIVSLGGLLGTRGEAGLALVHCRIGPRTVALECDAVRGILPASVATDPLPAGWFQPGRDCFSGVLRTPEIPVLELRPEALFPPRRQEIFQKLMTESEPSIEKLWELSELESKLSLNPSAAGYRELARHYAEAGWSDDSARLARKADELAPAETGATVAASRAGAAAYSGAFNPRVFVELIHVLHLSAKTGELSLAAPGGASVRVSFDAGRIVGAVGADAAPGEPALRRALGMVGGRYEFVAGTVASGGQGALADTAATLASLSAAIP